MLNKPVKKKNHTIHGGSWLPAIPQFFFLNHCCYHEYRSKILSECGLKALNDKNNCVRSSQELLTVDYTKQQRVSVKTLDR